ncbi:hypothetical protein LTR36_008959 [Oleoguttula mirabilis]|uniref:Arylsulfatase n=1 Tax=Oleoguttula mirabilis TaxID=1507867 RepID=A0AAV9J7H6_9PEZI|nr:hypothetical protein LTR36_008959 [Oleoguttula mirabilis]
MALSILRTVLAILPCLVAGLELAVTVEKPNIVFILTDDQDWHMESLDYMPLLRKHIINEGTLFDRHYCTVSICCPSRVNIWTGRAAHNTNVTDVHPPYGGYPKFVQQGLNENWLPVWLQDLGYNTYYTGKLFNAHSVDNYDDPLVKGFNGSDFLLDPYTYEYYRAHMTRNGAPPVSYEGQYSPDVVAEKAYGFLDEATQHDEPFFLAVAPIAPHADVIFADPVQFNPAKYASRHAHLFKDYKIPRTANFNPDTPSGVSWVKHLPQLNDTVIEYNDEFQRSRLRALQSVDEMVETLVQKLDAKGLLNNTYIFYTTDNGFHISQHRMPPGKECPFETDIHIPLIVRGPGIPAGHTAGVVSSHTDLTPTLLKLAGSDRPDLDGTPIPLSAEQLASPASGEHVNVEFWGRAIPEGKYGNDAMSAMNNTYKALRVVGDGYSLLYTVWCTGEKEYYDLLRDPDQMINYLGDDSASLAADYTLAGRSFEHLVSRLDSLLMVLKSCKAKTCHAPWTVLHPDGNVKTLNEALHGSYDGFYREQPKVSFSSCQPGYLVDAEGPQEVDVWGDEYQRVTPSGGRQQSFRYHGDWSLWT